MIGTSTPSSRIDCSSSASAPGSKVCRGCCGFGRIDADRNMGQAGAGGRPRFSQQNVQPPTQTAFRRAQRSHDLAGQGEVGLRAPALHVEQSGGLAVGGSFRKPDIAWNLRAEDLAREVLVHLVEHFGCQPRAAVVHRHQHSGDVQLWVQRFADPRDQRRELREAFERVVFSLYGDEHFAGRGQRVERQQAERRRAIDKDVIVPAGNGLERTPAAGFRGKASRRVRFPPRPAEWWRGPNRAGERRSRGSRARAASRRATRCRCPSRAPACRRRARWSYFPADRCRPRGRDTREWRARRRD